MTRAYFDHNATTPVRPEVIEAIGRVLRDVPGNPNSLHSEGVAARYEVERSRRIIARAVNAPRPESILFTSGGSEADNLALRGAAFRARRRGRGNHIIVSAAEHHAVRDTAHDLLEHHGFDLTVLPVDRHARVDAAELLGALRRDTILVSIIFANNEVGSLNPIANLVRITKKNSRALFHTDAVQALGRRAVDVQTLGVDLASFGAHKLGGPKGIGALYAQDGVELDAHITGGGQEQGLRSGTENVPAIVGFATAVQAALSEMAAEHERLVTLREELWRQIGQAVPSAVRNSPTADCLANTLSLSITGFASRDLVLRLDRAGFAISSGSACSSEGGEPSHVLLAMGVGEERAQSAIRLSLGRGNSVEEIAPFVQALSEIVGNRTSSGTGPRHAADR